MSDIIISSLPAVRAVFLRATGKLILIWVIFLAACREAAPDLSRPESNRFDKVVLAENLDEPMQFEILKDGRVLFVERKGAIKCYDPRTRSTQLLARVPVRHTFTAPGKKSEESEDGIQGILLDPDFEKNGWVYIYYAPLGGPPRNSLIRYKWDGGTMDLSKVDTLLEIPVDSTVCCHVGGGMVFDTSGNLLVATGENAQIGEFSTLDERPGKETSDGQRTSGNTNDLRGKIIRIHPLPDGSYDIPPGNLFPPGTPKTRPEIYTMGNRNPWRLSVDSKTNWLYWGEVGPGGGRDVEGRGPRAYDEFNQARGAGNYGYPYTIGNNFAYWKYDFATGTSGERYDPQHLVNKSPNNTGLEKLPPAKPAFIWYPYANSKEFPQLGSGGSSAVGGPIYHRSDFEHPARPFPAYYEGKWFITDWVRGWIMVVTMDENGDYQSMEELIPGLSLNGAIDMDFGPDGDLYVLEYGSNGTFKGNPDAQLIRIEYNNGNRKPVVKLSANKTAGAVPFTVEFSSEGSLDYDKDPLTYEWTIASAGKPARMLTGARASVPFTEAGIYTATLVVTDPHGAQEKKDIRIIAGNEPPQVQWDLGGANRTFFFPNTEISYTVDIRDREDGFSGKQLPDPLRTEVSIDFISEGSVVSKAVPSAEMPAVGVETVTGIRPVERGATPPYPAVLDLLVAKSNCRTCHQLAVRSLGPSFLEIAERYRSDTGAAQKLAKKIIEGGSGVWGESTMPAHPVLPVIDATTIAEYILGFKPDGGNRRQALPLSGKYVVNPVKEKDRRGLFVLRAAYTDTGAAGVPPLQAEHVVILKNPYVPASRMDQSHQSEFNRAINLDESDISMETPGAWIRLSNIDLTGIGALRIVANAFFPGDNNNTVPEGSVLEMRIDSPEGRLIGKTADTALASGRQTISEIEAVNGMHDLFLVFRNPNTGSAAGKIHFRGIEFRAR